MKKYVKIFVILVSCFAIYSTAKADFEVVQTPPGYQALYGSSTSPLSGGDYCTYATTTEFRQSFNTSVVSGANLTPALDADHEPYTTQLPFIGLIMFRGSGTSAGDCIQRSDDTVDYYYYGFGNPPSGAFTFYSQGYFSGSVDDLITNIQTTYTHFVSITSPANFATGLGTTVTLSGSYYMTGTDIHGTNDVGPGAFHPYITIQGASSEATSSEFSFLIPILHFDSFQSFSTTTVVLDNNRYRWDASFTCFNNDWGWYTCGQNASVNLSSGYGFFQFTTGSFNPASSLKAFDLSMCNPLSGFDAVTCLKNLIIPSEYTIGVQLGSLKTLAATVPPFGYLTRIISIIATSSTTGVPTLSYTFQNDSPLAGDTLTFNVSSYMTQAATLSNSMTSNTDHKNVWEIMGPIVNTFLYLILVFAILHDLTGIKLIHHKR